MSLIDWFAVALAGVLGVALLGPRLFLLVIGIRCPACGGWAKQKPQLSQPYFGQGPIRTYWTCRKCGAEIVR